MVSSLPDELLRYILAHAISLESDHTMVKPPSERLHPLFPGRTHPSGADNHYVLRWTMWRRSTMVAHNFVQVNRLWWYIAEQFLYSTFYFGKEEWRVQKFIDTIKSKPDLAGQLRTLGIMPCIHNHCAEEGRFRTLFEQVLSLCHGIAAIMVQTHLLEGSLPLLQSPESELRLLLLSALNQHGEEFPTFMRNFNRYANLQVLELSSSTDLSHLQLFGAGAEPSFPECITFPSLHTLLLGDLDWITLLVVAKWELPSLRELGLYMPPDASEELYPIIRQSYQRLEFLDVAVNALHHSGFHSITQAPPHLKNVTLQMTGTCSSAPTHPATNPFFNHVVTLGICWFAMIKREDQPQWVEFFSDSTYMPHLRSVLTDMTLDSYCEYLGHPSSPVIELLRSLEEVLSNRGVAFKGVMGDCSSFFLMGRHFFNQTPSRSACPCFVIDRCSSPYQHPSEGHRWSIKFCIMYISDVNVL